MYTGCPSQSVPKSLTADSSAMTGCFFYFLFSKIGWIELEQGLNSLSGLLKNVKKISGGPYFQKIITPSFLVRFAKFKKQFHLFYLLHPIVTSVSKYLEILRPIPDEMTPSSAAFAKRPL